MDWALTYQVLIKRAVDHIPNNVEFFETVAYLPSALINQVYRKGITEVVPDAILMGAHINYRLVDWAVREHLAEGGDIPNSGSKLHLGNRAAQEYGQAWIGFVSGWEHIGTSIRDDLKEANSNWSKLSQVGTFLEKHLHSTNQFLGRGAAFGDMLAIQWSSDLLLKWRSLVGSNASGRGYFRYTADLSLTTDLFNKEWAEVLLAIGEEEDSDVHPVDIFEIVLSNAWIDSKTITAMTLINWVTSRGAEGGASEALRRLSGETIFDRGWRGLVDRRGSSPSDWLTSLIRIVAGGTSYDHLYSSKLHDLRRQIEETKQSRRVSMRIYSSSGGGEISNEPAASYELLLIISIINTEGITFNRSVQEIIGSITDYQKRRRVLEFLRELIVEANKLDDSDLSKRISGVVGDEVHDTLGVAVQKVKEIVQRCIQQIEAHEDEEFHAAGIDEGRLIEVEIASSKSGFSKGTSQAPVALFSNVIAVERGGAEFIISFSNMDTGIFTDPPLASSAANEEEWLDYTISDHVAGVVMNDLVNRLDLIDVTANTAVDYWQLIKAEASSMLRGGKTPILLLSRYDEPDWMGDWIWGGGEGRNRPSDMRLNRLSNKPDGYRVNINEIEVYDVHLSEGKSLLIEAEILEELKFTTIDGRYVDAAFEPDANNVRKGVLSLMFKRDLVLNNGRAIRIKHKKDD